jgi:hypothetical protein
MNYHSGEKSPVHCAADYPASVFTALYLFAVNEQSESAVQHFIQQAWQPDGVWQQFIEQGLEWVKENYL